MTALTLKQDDDPFEHLREGSPFLFFDFIREGGMRIMKIAATVINRRGAVISTLKNGVPALVLGTFWFCDITEKETDLVSGRFTRLAEERLPHEVTGFYPVHVSDVEMLEWLDTQSTGRWGFHLHENKPVLTFELERDAVLFKMWWQ